MDALTRLLSPAIAMVNRQIGESTPARELALRLEGKNIAIRVRNTALAVYLQVAAGELVLADSDDPDPDVIVSGSLLSLGRLAGASGEELIRDGRIELDGDGAVANDFRNLLRFGKPDLEEQLSGVVGDTAAHGIGGLLRNVSRWGRGARQTVEQNVGEYLQEESRALPSRYEAEEFRDRVHELRDALARLDARVALVEKARGDG